MTTISVTVLPPPRTWQEAVERLRHPSAFVEEGRLLETILILVKYTYAVMFLFVPDHRIEMISVADVVSWVPGAILAIPFLLSATLSAIGLVQFVLGFEAARLRKAGATVGMMIWIFILWRNNKDGFVLAGLTPWCLWAGIFGSICIIRRANLPRFVPV